MRPRLEYKRILINRWSGHGFLNRVTKGVARYFSQKDDWLDFTKEGPKHWELLDGAITFLFEQEAVERWALRDRPVINLSNRLQHTPFPRVCSDDKAVGKMAAEYFLGKRFKRLLYYYTAPFHYVQMRKQGFRERLMQEGIEPIICEGIESLKAALKAGKVPLAIFTPEDEPALQVISIASEMGLEIPNEIAVLGTNNDEMMCFLSKPPLSSIDIPGEKIGYKAGELLDRVMQGETLEQKEYFVQPEGVIVRRTTDTIGYEDPLIRRAANLMLVNLHAPLGMTMMAAHLGVSRKKMERVFRSELGTTPHAFLRQLRFDRAKHLLHTTDEPISIIADRCGFSDYTKFSRFFSEEAGVPPSRWRKGKKNAAMSQSE